MRRRAAAAAARGCCGGRRNATAGASRDGTNIFERAAAAAGSGFSSERPLLRASGRYGDVNCDSERLLLWRAAASDKRRLRQCRHQAGWSLLLSAVRVHTHGAEARVYRPRAWSLEWNLACSTQTYAAANAPLSSHLLHASERAATTGRRRADAMQYAADDVDDEEELVFVGAGRISAPTPEPRPQQHQRPAPGPKSRPLGSRGSGTRQAGGCPAGRTTASGWDTWVTPADASLYRREWLERYWRGYYEKYAKERAFGDPGARWSCGFFDVPNFYVSHPRMTFWIGTTLPDEHRHLLISAADLPQLREELAARLRTPAATFPLPTTPLTDVERIEAAIFPDAAAVKSALAACQKENKKIKAREAAALRARVLDEARRAVRDGRSVFVSVDVEVYEANHDIVLELGWSYFDQYRPPPYPHPQNEKNPLAVVPKTAEDQRLVSRHYCNSDHRNTRNGKYCADRKGCFDFGKTLWGTVQDAVDHFKRDLAKMEHLVLVGHNLQADVKFLAKMGVHFSEDTLMLDTGHMDMALRNANQPVSLGKLLDRLDIEYWALHNAGNDARHTLEAFLTMAGCELKCR